MVFYAKLFFIHRNLRLLLMILLLLLVSLKRSPLIFTHCRAIRISEQLLSKIHDFQNKEIAEGEEKKVREALMIGSQPPRCYRKCQSCDHCEAVQVPISAGGIQHYKIKSNVDPVLKREAYVKNYWRGDGFSNYKPMCWKCKCGNLIFNP